MNPHPAAGGSTPNGLFAWYTPGHSDQLGDRLHLFDNTDGPPLELLRLRPDFAAAPGFEHSLRARVAELRDFGDERYARVCRTDRLPEPGGGLSVVSERVEGRRLSELLRLASRHGVRLPAPLAIAQVAGLVDAVAALHALGSSLAHGTLGPERLVVTPDGALRVTEYVLGSALRGLRLERDRARRQLRLALPAEPGVEAFDQPTDMVQIGAVGLALVLSRMLDAGDYPSRIEALLEEADRRGGEAGWARVWPLFRPWLERALAVAGPGFANALDAREALGHTLGRAALALRPGDAWQGFEVRLRAADADPGLLALDEWDRPAATTVPEDASTTAPEPAASPAARIEEGALPGAGSRATEPRGDLAEPAPRDLEATPGAATPPQPLVPRRGFISALRAWPAALVALVALAVLTLAGGVSLTRHVPGYWAGGRAAATGTARLESEPPGAGVTVDGKAAGTTPVSLQLEAGRHVVEIASGGRRRSLTIETKPGETTSLVVALAPPAPATGQVRVSTTPPGLAVLVDGRARGASPLLVAGLAPGEHEVRIEGRGRAARQAVTVEAGVTAAVALRLPNPDAPAPGWLSIESPEEVQVYNEGELLGTSRTPRIMLPAGRYELDLVNDELGVRTSEEAVVRVGRTTTIEPALPNGRLDVNATPWAEVFVDGRRVGETPLARVTVTVGRHVVTLRHPELGERRVECVVSVKQPTRLGVDLRK